MNGELFDWHDAKVHVLTHAMHYGSGVFEGIRAYPTTAGAAVFRLGDHILRLFASAKIFMIDIPFTVAEIIEATRTVVRANGPHRRLLHPPARLPRLRRDGPQPAPCPINVSIAAWPWGTYLGDEGVQRRDAQDQLLAAPRPQRGAHGGQGHGHVPELSLAKVEAMKAGYDEAILLPPTAR